MSHLPLSLTHGASLAVISQEVSRASAVTPLHYVERRADVYRWSPAHRGGPYPLLRVTAKLLGVDHRELVLPFRGLPKTAPGFGADGFWDGLCIVAASEHATPPDAWTVLELEQPVTQASIQKRLAAALNH